MSNEPKETHKIVWTRSLLATLLRTLLMLSLIHLAGLLFSSLPLTLASPTNLCSGCFPTPKKPPKTNPPPNLQWTPCYDNSNTQCATFEPPLDYAKPEVGTAKLTAIRYLSTATPRLGTIWMNPGGPGGSGIHYIAAGVGASLSAMTGGQYDIASWDPRGVNNSLPQVECFSNKLEENTFWSAAKVTSYGIEVKGNFTDPADVNALLGQVDVVDGLLVDLARRCTEKSGDNLQYVGTAATVRDLAAMADAVDGVGSPVNFWGFSYGTIVGTWFMNMFPGRVGRFVLDAVVNPDYYANKPAYLHWGNAIFDTENVLKGFAKECSAAGPNCWVAWGRKPQEIYDWVQKLLADTYDDYKWGGKMSSAALRDSILRAMYTPRKWTTLSHLLNTQWEAIHGIAVKRSVNGTRDADGQGTALDQLRDKLVAELEEDDQDDFEDSFALPLKHSSGFSVGAVASLRKRMTSGRLKVVKTIQDDLLGRAAPDGYELRKALEDPRTHIPDINKRITSPADMPAQNYNFVGITCGDAADPNYTTRDTFEDLVRVTKTVSTTFGPAWGFSAHYCHRWPARAKERYTGPWNPPIKGRILIVGNKYDPITPYSNAKYLANIMKGKAFLLKRKDYGHGSASMNSDCTTAIIRDYFVSGTLPQDDKERCPTNEPLFTDYVPRPLPPVPGGANVPKPVKGKPN